MQAFSGKKMGPSGPRTLMVCPGPFRVVICSRSPSWFAATRVNPAHTSVSTRDTGPTIAEQFWASTPSAKGFSGGFRARLGPSQASSGEASSNMSPSSASTCVAARRSSAATPCKGLIPAALPGLALGLDLARALAGQPRDDHAAVGIGANPFDVTARGQVIEHLGDRRGGQPRGAREISRRELAALVELDQQLELGVAQLRAGQVGVAPAQAAEAAEHPAKLKAELGQLVAGPWRCRLCRCWPSRSP